MLCTFIYMVLIDYEISLLDTTVHIAEWKSWKHWRPSLMHRYIGMPCFLPVQVEHANIDFTSRLCRAQQRWQLPRVDWATGMWQDVGSGCLRFLPAVCNGGGSSKSMVPSWRTSCARKSSWVYPAGQTNTPGCSKRYSVNTMYALMTAHCTRSKKMQRQLFLERRKRLYVEARWSKPSTPPM